MNIKISPQFISLVTALAEIQPHQTIGLHRPIAGSAMGTSLETGDKKYHHWSDPDGS